MSDDVRSVRASPITDTVKDILTHLKASGTKYQRYLEESMALLPDNSAVVRGFLCLFAIGTRAGQTILDVPIHTRNVLMRWR